MAPDGESDPDVTFENPSIVINQQDALVLPVTLKRNQTLYCDGSTVKLYDRQWKVLQTVSLSKPFPKLENGVNEIGFDGGYSGANGPGIKIKIRAKGNPEAVWAGTK